MWVRIPLSGPNLVPSFSGMTTAFEAVYVGSIPTGTANLCACSLMVKSFPVTEEAASSNLVVHAKHNENSI